MLTSVVQENVKQEKDLFSFLVLLGICTYVLAVVFYMLLLVWHKKE